MWIASKTRSNSPPLISVRTVAALKRPRIIRRFLAQNLPKSNRDGRAPPAWCCDHSAKFPITLGRRLDRNDGGGSCCDTSDCRVVDYRIGPKGYEAFVDAIPIVRGPCCAIQQYSYD